MRKYIRDSFRIFYESLVTVVDEAVDKFLGWLDRGIEPEWKQCDSCTCEPFTETEVRPLQAAVDVAIAPLVEERVQALTAERDDWHESATHRLSEGMRFRAERDAARAELAAANTRCAELEAGVCTRCGGKGWVPFHGGEIPCRTCEPDHPKAPRVEIEHIRDGRSTCKVYRDGVAVFYGINPKAEQTIAALQATLDRVTALADEWEVGLITYEGAQRKNTYSERLRAALTPEGTQ